MLDELQAACTDSPLERWQIGPMWDIFASDPVPSYPHTVNYADVEDLAAIIIHSSGTTGNPKPVVVTHGYLATIDNMQTLPVPEGRQTAQMFLLQQGQLRFFHSPLFHFMGLVCIAECLYFKTPFLLAPDRPLTTSLFVHIMNKENPPVWGLLTPYTLETLAASEEGLQALAKLSAVNYGGAPMGQATGERLSSIVILQTLIGSSETSYTPTLLCEDPADWGYLEWNPAFELRMESVGDDLWQLILPRPKTRQYHGIFHSFPHLTQYRTGDLFRPHPSKPGLWHYEGRSDDVIVLKNGEKFNPTAAEKLVESHHLIKHAAIFGQDRFQATLLLEPEWKQLPSAWTPDWLKLTLWPLVEKANSLLPGHGKIFESHMVIASSDNPFSLSPKGTLRRREIARSYRTILDELYEPQKPMPQRTGQFNEAPGTTFSEIQEWIQEIVAHILALNTVGRQSDFASLGMDSLQVVRLSQVLQNAEKNMQLVEGPVTWTSEMIYDLASIPNMANTLYRRIHGRSPETDATETRTWPREDLLTKLIWEQAQFLGSGGLTVALTGSTGELGSYLLNTLVQDPSIKQIYCLNRSGDAAERQLASFEKKHLSSVWLAETSRVKFWLSHLDEEYLGLAPERYNFLKQNVDVIIHNAWPVDFNQPIANFQPQITGVRRLLTLVENSVHNADFHFVSSVSAVLGQSSVPGSTIMETLQSMNKPLRLGYGESKYVGEALCSISSQRSVSRITIHRVGQLGGPSNLEAGMWNPRDWLPSLVRSSHTMGTIPDSLGPFQVDWLPIDAAARIMNEIVQTQRSKLPSEMTIYHILNPHTTDWKEVVGTVAKACEANIVSLAEWVRMLELQAANGATDLRRLPAAGLLSFFQMLVRQEDLPRPRLDFSNTKRDSTTMCAQGPVDQELMEVWLSQWKEWIPELAI
ncbi:NRPS-like enzyme, putative [Penicillium digitatum Pd1]|nr:NRPS-like enzyme, putative [Penicillium digitatum Pd1]EKV05363.1 NRPS-like enzyme, putative [Penicillium digitatum Pd1]